VREGGVHHRNTAARVSQTPKAAEADHERPGAVAQPHARKATTACNTSTRAEYRAWHPESPRAREGKCERKRRTDWDLRAWEERAVRSNQTADLTRHNRTKKKLLHLERTSDRGSSTTGGIWEYHGMATGEQAREPRENLRV